MERILVSTRLEQRQQAMRERHAPAAPVTSRPFSGNSIPELLTPREAAAILRVSQSTISRLFKGRPDTIDLGHAGTRKKRSYRVLRIPLPVLQRFLAERSGAVPRE